MRAWFVLAIVLASSPASADYTKVMPVRPLTLSDPAGLTSVVLELQLTRWTELRAPDLEVDLQNLTFDLAADIRLAPHWVLIARLPLSRTSIDGDPLLDDCCGFGLGNLTVGARGLWASLRGNGRMVAGGELSLSGPTASDSGEGGISASTGALARLPHDPGRYLPDTTTLRFTPLVQYYTPRFLLQGELGMQLYFFDNDLGDDSDLAVRLAFAFGVRVNFKVAILAELNSLFVVDDTAGDDSVTSLDLGVRYASDTGAMFGARLYLPIDEDLRDLDMLGLGLDGGFRF